MLPQKKNASGSRRVGTAGTAVFRLIVFIIRVPGQTTAKRKMHGGAGGLSMRLVGEKVVGCGCGDVEAFL